MKKKREQCRLSLKKLSCSFDHIQNTLLNKDLTIVGLLVIEKTTKEIINHKGTRMEKIVMDYK